MTDQAMGDGRPLLLVVSGVPGAGKTMLAAQLGRELGLPVIGKDVLKETLADVLGTESIEQSQVLGLAAIRVMYAVAAELVRAGVSIILESNFSRGWAEGDLAPLLSLSRGAHVVCQAPAGLCVRRYRERAESGERHPTHFDRQRLAAWDAPVPPWANALPPELPVPTLVVDTGDGYAPPLNAVLAWVRGLE